MTLHGCLVFDPSPLSLRGECRRSPSFLHCSINCENGPTKRLRGLKKNSCKFNHPTTKTADWEAYFRTCKTEKKKRRMTLIVPHPLSPSHRSHPWPFVFERSIQKSNQKSNPESNKKSTRSIAKHQQIRAPLLNAQPPYCISPAHGTVHASFPEAL